MPLLIGVDEAGYGPNLGPLVIAATGWLVPDGVTHEQLATHLSDWICDTPPRPADGRVWIADSKQVYRARRGLAALERGVLCMMSVGHPTEIGDAAPWFSNPLEGHRERWPPTLRDLWQRCDAAYGLDAGRAPWYADHPVALPVDPTGELPALALDFSNRWYRQPVRYLGAMVSIVMARRFNSLLRKHGTKSSLLTHATLRLVKRCLGSWAGCQEIVDVVCDKHGGRNRYAAMLQSGQTDALVMVHQEKRPLSRYGWRDGHRDVRWRFVMKSERWLPSALASMTAKYIRELSMLSFNAYWAHHVPGIRPTAGYPTDARRFRREISDAQRRLRLPDRWLWRSR